MVSLTATRDPRTESDIERFEVEALEHLPALMAVSRRLTRNQAEAEDLVQDTFVKAIRAREQYQAGTNLRAWLLRILKNTFINRYHRRNVERNALSASVPDPVSDGWLSQASLAAMRDPEATALQPALERELGRCIDQLPEDFRLVVLLTDVQGFSYKETADILGCPIGTVMSRLHRARRLLKSALLHHARDLGLVQPEPEIGEGEPIPLHAFRASGRKTGSDGGKK